MDTSKYRNDSLSGDNSTVDIDPPGPILFRFMPNKTIIGEFEIRNLTITEKVYRVLATQPQEYNIKNFHGVIGQRNSQLIEIRMKCLESRLEHRLQDKFKVQVMEKSKFDMIYEERDRWRDLYLERILSISLTRSEIVPQPLSQYYPQTQLVAGSSIKRSNVNRQFSFKQYDEMKGSSGLINSFKDEGNVKRKFEQLQRKYDEQKTLIEQYRVDINELQNEIDRNAFIYGSDSRGGNVAGLGVGSGTGEDVLIKAITQQAGIPLWELFIAATVALLLGAILNRK